MRFLVALIISIVVFGVRRVTSKLVSAAVLPHGDFAFDPELLKNYPGYASSKRLHEGSWKVARKISSSKPDTIVLVTPHGIEVDWNVAVYTNPSLSGNATLGRDLDESFGKTFPKRTVARDYKTDTETARKILQRAAILNDHET